MQSSLKSQFPFSLFKIRSKESAILYLSMFIMGGCGLAYEYTLSKVASDLLGNSVRQWAIIIGVMMFFMGLGSDLQKYFSNKNLVDQFILFEILLGLLGAFGPIALIYSYGQFPSHYVLVQYFFISSIGLIIGFEIPLITRINESYIQELKLNIGAVLKMDYIGALAGSLAWIFILPKFFSITESAFVLGILNVFVGGFTLLFFKRLINYKLPILASFIVVLIAVVSGLFLAKHWTSYSEQFLYRDRIVFSETTPYQHIVLTESRSEDISCYINGHLQFNSWDEHIYHENLVHPAFLIAPRHKNILILGGGDGLALREVLKYPDVQSVTLCDIDPTMTTLAKKNQYFREINNRSLEHSKLNIIENHALLQSNQTVLEIENQNSINQPTFQQVAEVKIINLDATKFVEQISGLFDIIIIDFPDPNSPDLAKLYSLQFYSNLKKKLAAFGLLVQQSTSPVHAKEVFLCIGRTMEAARFSCIPYHDNVPSFGEWGWWIAGNAEKYSPKQIFNKLENIETIPVKTKYLTPKLLKSSLHFGKDQLNSNYSDFSTLANSLVSKLYLQAWQR